MKSISTIGGTDGTENGVKVAKVISSCVFKAALLMEYYWTGKGPKDSTKVPFVKYTRIIQLLFDVIYLASNKFTQIENKNYIVYRYNAEV